MREPLTVSATEKEPLGTPAMASRSPTSVKKVTWMPTPAPAHATLPVENVTVTRPMDESASRLALTADAALLNASSALVSPSNVNWMLPDNAVHVSVCTSRLPRSSPFSVPSSALLYMLMQRPWREHSYPAESRGQVNRSHASPSKLSRQSHTPVARSHSPMLLHSVSACAVLSAVASSYHARPNGHERSAQAAPVYPSQQSQV
mmetsp:Transcript_26934/g.93491  ORF Transcript_26934/g.93491 Transcript_26934/m.93491 type:complete len:204 (+) Transcript_26934:773-1384(+)